MLKNKILDNEINNIKKKLLFINKYSIIDINKIILKDNEDKIK